MIDANYFKCLIYIYKNASKKKSALFVFSCNLLCHMTCAENFVIRFE